MCLAPGVRVRRGCPWVDVASRLVRSGERPAGRPSFDWQWSWGNKPTSGAHRKSGGVLHMVCGYWLWHKTGGVGGVGRAEALGLDRDYLLEPGIGPWEKEELWYRETLLCSGVAVVHVVQTVTFLQRFLRVAESAHNESIMWVIRTFPVAVLHAQI